MADLGARIGPRIARVVVDAQADHLRKTANTRAWIEAEGKHVFWRDVARERDTHLKPLLELLGQHENLDPALHQALSFMRTHHGELAGLLVSRGVGTAFGVGIGAGIADLLAPINQRIMQTAPNIPIGVSDAVSAVNAGLWSEGDGATEAARQGINSDRFSVLWELGINWPDLAQLLDLWRRGLTNGDYVRLALERQGVHKGIIPQLLETKRVPLLPADLALMTLRGIIDRDQGAAVAAESGMTPGDFDLLTFATGEPPAAESMNEALRRGFIDDATYEKAIRQSRIRDEWIPVMKQLRFAPMATADAVEAVVRNYIDADQGRAIAEQNGLLPEHWPVLLEAHGRPPGLMQMMALWNRGEASQAQVEQSIRESDIKDKYVPTLLGLRYKIPSERILIELVETGSMPATRAQQLLEKDGYEPDVAGALLKAGTAKRTAKHKVVALGTVEQLYEAHAIDQAKATELIVALGYPPEDVPLILASADLKRELKYREQAIGAIRAGYLARKISEPVAAQELAAAGVPTDQAGQLLRLWVLELVAKRRTLTEAQIIHAHRQGHLNDADTITRLEGIGYDTADATFLLTTAGPIPKGA